MSVSQFNWLQYKKHYHFHNGSFIVTSFIIVKISMNKNYLLREREKARLDANVLPLEEKGGGAGVWRRSRSRWKEVQRGGRGDTLSTLSHPTCLGCVPATLVLSHFLNHVSEWYQVLRPCPWQQEALISNFKCRNDKTPLLLHNKQQLWRQFSFH